MGNLNCFKYNERQYKSRWFDEWQNNSSFQRPCNYYDRNCDRINEENISPDQEMIKTFYPNNYFSPTNYPGYGPEMADPSQYNEENNNYKMQLQQYYNGEPYGADPMAPIDNFHVNFDASKNVKDNVQEAYMSDWFVREEAELNCNVKTLQKGDLADNDNETIIPEEVVKIKSKGKKDTKKDCESLDDSSDSDMCCIDNLAKPENKTGTLMGFTTKKNSKCCYTAYIMCNNSVEWDNFLKKSARVMTGLQRQFGCVIKFSDKISFHRGNSVRTFQIIGSHKGNVIRCKAALPKMVSKMLITSMTCSAEVEEYSRECNRESKPTLNRKPRYL